MTLKMASSSGEQLPGQVVLVLQGGGALGAYQVGVYQALHEAGVEPDWVIGTSIGAINAGIIAGSKPGERLDRLTEFWRRMEHGHAFEWALPTQIAASFRNSLAYAVHIWNPHGPEPVTIQEVLNRQKDVQYSSRAGSHIKRQRQLHRLRHVITELSALVPPDQRQSAEVAALAAYGCPTRM